MKRIKFTSTDAMRVYIDNPVWEDGDVREVRDEIADNLMTSFGNNFSLVEERKAVIQPPEDKAMHSPGKHKGKRK